MGGKGSVAHAGGYFYGDVLKPTDFGSDATWTDVMAGDVYTTSGGGVINITATTSATIDGEL